jgi:hypothetical protein
MELTRFSVCGMCQDRSLEQLPAITMVMATKTIQAEKTRVQIDLAPIVVEKLDQLVDDTGSATRAEVLRKAISIFAFLVEEAKSGSKTEVLTKQGERKTLVL